MDSAIQKRLNQLGVGDDPVKEDVLNEYRVLRKGEIIREDDEYFSKTNENWYLIKDLSPFNSFIGKPYDCKDVIRRKTYCHIRGDKAIEILNELCESYLKNCNGVMSIKLTRIIKEWDEKNLKGKKCKILHGFYKDKTGFIVGESINRGKPVFKIKLANDEGNIRNFNQNLVERI